MTLLRFNIFIIFIIFAVPAFSKDIKVVATIKPVHSLVASVMEGTGEPVLLVNTNASPHDYHLKPSDMRKLSDADIVFYVDAGFETFLHHALSNIPSSVQTLALSKTPNLRLLKNRGTGHSHHENEHNHDMPTGVYNMHFWLSPQNAIAVTHYIAEALGKTYPEFSDRFTANATRLAARLTLLDGSLSSQMKSLEHKPFLVFHDAYPYLESDYNLAFAGAITSEPDSPPGARHLQYLYSIIRSRQVVCIFQEPQFQNPMVDTIAADTHIKKGILDPEGYDIPPGPELYFTLMEKLAKNLVECLK